MVIIFVGYMTSLTGYIMLYFSQVGVSFFFQIGNIDVEQFIKFITAIMFVVKSHLDSIFTVFLLVRLNSAFVIVLVGLVAMVTLSLTFIASGIC